VIDEPYPPRSHALRDLPFEMVVVDESHHVAEVDLDAGLVDGGRVSVGALATIVDVLAGALCGRAVAPDWMATSSLTLHLGAVPQRGAVRVDARLARLGRTTLVVQVGLGEGSLDLARPEPGRDAFGDGAVTFSRLPRRDTNLDIADYQVSPGDRTSFALEGSGLRTSFEQAIGTRVLDAAHGVTRTAVQPYVQNSFGAVNGGIVAAIADVAARAALGAACEQPAGVLRTTDLAVHHLSQVRSGAVATRATLLDPAGAVHGAPGSHTVRIELFDAELGESDPDDVVASWATAMAVAHVTVRAPGRG
jgi:acyl-coenzyme A thioesterase PaaI-like protein